LLLLDEGEYECYAAVVVAQAPPLMPKR